MVVFRLVAMMILLAGTGCSESPPAADPETPSTAAACPEPESEIPTRSGRMVLVVDDMEKAEKAFNDLLTRYGGSLSGRDDWPRIRPGAPVREGAVPAVHLRARLDSRHFDAARQHALAIGDLLDDQSFTVDPAEAMVVLQARFATERQNESRIQARLDDPSLPPEALPGLEGEISRVRERLAELASKLYVLENRIAYARLEATLFLRPEEGLEGKPLWQEIRNTFIGPDPSPGGMLRQAVVITIAALPWWGLVVLFGVFFLLAVRRNRSLRP